MEYASKALELCLDKNNYLYYCNINIYSVLFLSLDFTQGFLTRVDTYVDVILSLNN